ncbi:carboxymuconolactone decarboxylase family protein [Roseibium sp. M-1]
MTDLFQAHDETTAPKEVREAIAAMRGRLGFLPSMMAKFAEAPALLKGYQAAAGEFEKTSLSPEQRLVVLMTASFLHNCDFCMSAHSWGARRQDLAAGLVDELRSGGPISDPKLEALRVFTARVVTNRGAVGRADTEVFLAAGFTTRQALEVVLGVALKVMTNYTNALAGTPPNPEFGEDIWIRHQKAAAAE